MATTVADLLVKLSADPRDFEKAMSRVGGRVRQLGKKMSAAGRQMTMRFSAPLAAAGLGATKMAADFDLALSRIVGLVGVAEDQVADWRDEILALAPALGRSPQELAEGMFFVTSAGARGAEALRILEASAKAAAAGLGETTIIADAVTSAVNAYGAANISAAQATSVLVATVREGKADAASIAPVLGRLLAMASNLGISFDQVGAAIAAMTRLGLDAATSATALRQVMVTLQKPTKGAEDTLREYGSSVQELRHQVREKGLLSVLMRLRETFAGNEEAMAKVFPNVRALTGALTLVGANAEATGEIFDRMAATTEDDLTRAFEAAEKQAGFKLQQALARLKTTMIELGDVVGPTIVPMFERMAAGAKSVGEWLDKLSPSMRKFLTTAGAAVVVLGPLVWILGSIVGAVGTLISAVGSLTGAISGSSALATAVSGITAAFGSLGTAITTFTGLSVAASAAAVAAAGGLGYLAGQLIRLVPGVKKWEEALATAEGAHKTLVDGMLADEDTFRTQLELYNRMRKEVGATGEKWRVGAELTRENASKLLSMTDALRKAIEQYRKFNPALDKSNEALERQNDLKQMVIDAYAEEKQAQDDRLAALKEEYGLMGREDVVNRLKEMVEQYDFLRQRGISVKEIAKEWGTELDERLRQAQDYSIKLPEGVRRMGGEVGKVVPEVQKLLDSFVDVGPAYENVGGRLLEGVIKVKDGIAESLSGGFGEGVEKGVKYGDQAMRRWEQDLLANPIRVPLSPFFTEGMMSDRLAQYIRDVMSGEIPNTGGQTP